MTASGAIDRVAHGVYRMVGAPPHNHENIYATWLALGGATAARTELEVSTLVAGGVTAAIVHEIGDFFLDGLDFIVGSRKTTRLPDVRLRIRALTPDDVVPVNGLPTLTVERTLVDLLELGTDTSLVVGALRDAARLDKIVNPDHLRFMLTGLPARQINDGIHVTDALNQLLGEYNRAVRDDFSKLAHKCSPDVPRYDLVMTAQTPQTHGPLSGPMGRRVAAHRQELLDALRRRGVTNPEILGSSARGDDRQGSDLDLLVDFAPDTDLIDMVNIRAELEEILGSPVDLIPRDGLKDRVRIAAARDLVPL